MKLQKLKWCKENQGSDILRTLIMLQNLTSITAVQCIMPIGTRLEKLHIYGLKNLKTIKEYANTYV